MAPRPRRWSLTTKLVATILGIMAAVLLMFGSTTVVVMHRNLHQRLDSEVQQAAMRSLAFAGNEHDELRSERNPLDAPGQPTRALALVAHPAGGVASGYYRSADGSATALSARDVRAIAEAGLLATTGSNAAETAAVRDVDLSIGEYRLLPLVLVGGDEDDLRVLVTGLPTSSVDGPVTALAMTELFGGLAALGIAGAIATVAIRRSLRPLERISQAATDVAALPLASGQVDLAEQRVPDDLARPGTEVGNVGNALNLMIDSVDDALSARARSEDRLRKFVADASHELRTPLAAVRGYTSMIRLTEDLGPDGRTSLARVESQTDRMTGLVEDLLMLARLDEGRAPAYVDLDLSELAVEAVMDATAVGPGHDYSCQVPEEPMTVHGDGGQLAQVLANLLSNARKHTPAGTAVNLDVHRGADGWVETVVVDDGPGIAPEFVPHLFDRFARGDPSRTAGEGSTGLGLAIVDAVVRAHGGTVSCESRPGRTAFTVRLPPAGSG